LLKVIHNITNQFAYLSVTKALAAN